MKKSILSLAAVTTLLAGGAMAEEKYEINKTYSLIGIDVGYGSMSQEVTDASVTPNTFTSTNSNVGSLGLRLGAQGENYRVFFEGRFSQDADSDFDYFVDYGATIDYMFNFSKAANFFIGINGGVTYAKLTIPSEPFSRTLSGSYYGGNVGFNIHATSALDVELSMRTMITSLTNEKNSVKYDYPGRYMGMVGLIYHYEMD